MAVLTRHMLPLLLLVLHTILSSAQRLAHRATIVDSVADLKAQYDYVIVGGGTSGLTVAYRLTEDPSGTLFALKRRVKLTSFVLYSIGPCNRVRSGVRAG